jgi:hypothetical protein
MQRVNFVFALLGLSLAAGSPLAAEEGAHHTFRYLTTAGYPETFRTFTFSPDSTQLAISAARNVDFIDLKTGTITGQHKGSSPFEIRYSRDGNGIYMISEYKATLLDTLTGANKEPSYREVPGYLGVQLEQQSGKLLFARIDSEGALGKLDAVKVGDELIGVADGRHGYMLRVTGKSVKEVNGYLQGRAGDYVQLQVLPRGKFGEANAVVHLVRRQAITSAGNQRKFLPFTPAKLGEHLAWCTSDGRHEFRSAATGGVIARLQAIDVNNTGQYAISPDQTRFAIVALQRKNSSAIAVEVFDLATQERLAYMPMPKDSHSGISFAPDNNRVLVATWDSIEVADTKQQQFVARLTLGWQPPTEKKDPEYSGIAASVVRAAADNLAFGPIDHTRSPRQLAAAFAVSSQGIVATADRFGGIRLWDLESGVKLHELPPISVEKAPDEMAFSPNGEWLAFHVEGVLHTVDVSAVKPLSEEELAQRKQEAEALAAQTAAGQSKSLIPGLPLGDAPQQVPFAIRVDAKVEVRSRGRWYAAVVVREDGEGRWQIHYDDSPEDWDEIVTAPRIRPRAD